MLFKLKKYSISEEILLILCQQSVPSRGNDLKNSKKNCEIRPQVKGVKSWKYMCEKMANMTQTRLDLGTHGLKQTGL